MLTSGTQLGHYEITSLLGSGGMGEVYKGHDERLDRDVAIKVLPSGTLADEHARKRFRKEALALSKLNHPNIATAFDFDTQERVDFIVMEYVDGASLSEKVKTGRLTEKEVVGLGSQIAEALEEAHERGVIHRDLKPGNIAVTPKGRVKVLDFGLARMLRPVSDEVTTEALTQEHAVAGTLPYMSPEELRGERADHRSDLFSCGVVLYEMATGRRPFEHTLSTALTDAIIHKPPEPPSTHNRKISLGLESIIIKALDKDPDHRYQSAREMRVDLERLSAPVSVAVPKRGPLYANRWLWAGVGLAVVLAVLAVLNVGGLRNRLTGEPITPSINSIAVLPLENLSGDPDQEYFSDGMTEELIAELAKIEALRVISRQSVMQFKGKDTPLPDIAKALKVDAIVEGSVRRSGDKVRITTQLVHTSPERHLWASSYERDLQNILSLQRTVAQAIVREIRINVTTDEESRLFYATPVNPEAYDAVLKGRFFLNKTTEVGFLTAIEYFNQAIGNDPFHGPAYAGLADSYIQLSYHQILSPAEAYPKAREAAMKALEIDETLAEAHTALGLVKQFKDWDWSGAGIELKRAVEADPGSVTAHLEYSAYLVRMGRFDDALSVLNSAEERDPLSILIPIEIGHLLYCSRQYDEALQQLLNTRETNPSFHHTYWYLGWLYTQMRQFQNATESFREQITLMKGANVADEMAALAYTYGLSDNEAEAQRQIEELHQYSRTHYVSPYTMARAYSGLKDQDQALQWLEKAYNERSAGMTHLKIRPHWDPLRNNPRFRDILRRMKFPE